MSFEKGKSGNPGGRPRKSESQINFERKCREWAELHALDKLKKASDSEKAGEVIAAVKEICDRGFGKPEAVSYLEANVTTDTGASASELAREVADALGAAASEGGGSNTPNPVDSGK